MPDEQLLMLFVAGLLHAGVTPKQIEDAELAVHTTRPGQPISALAGRPPHERPMVAAFCSSVASRLHRWRRNAA